MKWPQSLQEGTRLSAQAPCPSIGLLLAVTEVPFDLAEVKLAATVAPARHRGEGGRDRTAERRGRACGDRGRAGRLRQDDAPCPLGRGRSAAVRVGRARRARRRPRRAPALHRGRDSPSRAGPSRGVRRVVRPRGVRLGDARPACRERTGRTRASARTRARRSARCRQSGLSGRARGAFAVRAGGLADRGREQARAGPAPRPLASARAG